MSVKTPLSFTQKSPVWLFALGITILIITSWLWWTRIYLDPKNVFWGMLENSLATSSVTVETMQQDTEASLKQTVRYELGTTNKAHSIVTLRNGTNQATTEIVATPDTDYSRYTSIKTEQTGEDGKALNFSKILNVWSKTDKDQNQLFGQVVLGSAVPQANFAPKQRQALLDQLHKEELYQTSFKDVQKRKKDGREQYVYKVKMQRILYVRYLKNFSKQLGMHDLDQLDPNDYRSAEPMEVTLVVDALSRQLVAVERNDDQPSLYYSGYGIPVRAEAPVKAITNEELEGRFNDI